MPQDLPERVPLPLAPSRGDREKCVARGYCGPFVNVEFYNAFPDPSWHGYGDCVVCHSTRLTTAEEAKRQQVLDSGGGQPPQP